MILTSKDQQINTSPALARTLADDISAGDEFVSLNRARRDPRLKIDGRTRDLSWIYRAALEGVRGSNGRRVVLEATTQSGVKVTTRSAITRFVLRQMDGSATPTQAGKSHTQAVGALARNGF